MGKMLKQARDMQSRLAKLQEDLGKQEVLGSAGGGLVTVTLNGRAEVLRMHIDPRATANVQELESMVTAAYRDAHAQVKQIMQRELGGAAGLLGGALPGA
jgi:DNA-binding YbaB/EbfC family protein